MQRQNQHLLKEVWEDIIDEIYLWFDPCCGAVGAQILVVAMMLFIVCIMIHRTLEWEQFIATAIQWASSIAIFFKDLLCQL